MSFSDCTKSAHEGECGIHHRHISQCRHHYLELLEVELKPIREAQAKLLSYRLVSMVVPFNGTPEMLSGFSDQLSHTLAHLNELSNMITIKYLGELPKLEVAQ